MYTRKLTNSLYAICKYCQNKLFRLISNSIY